MPYSINVKEKSKALRRKGFSLNEISEKLDISKTTIHDWVSHAVELDGIAKTKIAKLKGDCSLSGNLPFDSYMSLIGRRMFDILKL
jgi:orotate phosphoribosyltransferase-like protein